MGKQAYDPWSKITTRNGYACDEVISSLQKCIRRGKEEGFGREHKGREEKIEQQKVGAWKTDEGKQKQREKKHAEAVIEREFLIR